MSAPIDPLNTSNSQSDDNDIIIIERHGPQLQFEMMRTLSSWIVANYFMLSNWIVANYFMLGFVIIFIAIAVGNYIHLSQFSLNDNTDILRMFLDRLQTLEIENQRLTVTVHRLDKEWRDKQSQKMDNNYDASYQKSNNGKKVWLGGGVNEIPMIDKTADKPDYSYILEECEENDVACILYTLKDHMHRKNDKYERTKEKLSFHGIIEEHGRTSTMEPDDDWYDNMMKKREEFRHNYKQPNVGSGDYAKKSKGKNWYLERGNDREKYRDGSKKPYKTKKY